MSCSSCLRQENRETRKVNVIDECQYSGIFKEDLQISYAPTRVPLKDMQEKERHSSHEH